MFIRPFPHGRKDKISKKLRRMDWREAEALGTLDIPTILLVDSKFYIMYPHNEKWVLWL
jgi:hypothetical protein